MQFHESDRSLSRKTSAFLLGLVFALSFALQPLPAAAAETKPAPSAMAKPGAPLNQKEIRAAYNEGNFDKVTTLIEAFKRVNKAYSRADSIFIAKHLAVVYSANPQSREKGKYYMYRMLEMMPSAELVDMYVSEEVDRIFEKVRKEYLTRQKSFGIDSTQVSAGTRPASGGTQAGMDKSTAHPNSAAGETSGPSGEYLAATREDKRSPYWRKNGFWIAGGLGLLAAGTAAYFVYSQQETSSGKTITIGQDTNK